MHTNTRTPSKATRPLETLIVWQLAEIKREEQLLKQRFQTLGTVDRGGVEMNSLSDQLSKFDERANRLFRLVQAMEVC
jgi:hypothetical protein